MGIERYKTTRIMLEEMESTERSGQWEILRISVGSRMLSF